MWRTRAFLADLALAAALCALSAASISLTAQKYAIVVVQAKIPGDTLVAHPLAFWWWFAAPIAGGLLLRQRWPVAALVLAAAGLAAHRLAGFKQEPLDLALPLILYSVAGQARSRWHSTAALAGTVLLTYVLALVGPLVDPKAIHLLGRLLDESLWLPPDRLPTQEILLLVAAFAVGDGVRSRRERLRAIEERTAELARSHRQRAALAAAAERARITRELHDVVAHGVSVMVVQAQGAAAALERHPDRTAVALQHVIETGRASLAEMRRLLAAGADPGVEAELAPQPGLAEAPTLIDDLRRAGMPASLEVTGSVAALPAAIDLSGYRIVQEALTNALKHAGPGASATVRLAFRPERVEIEVSDDGAGAPPGFAGHGNGLRGISERVALLGGRLTLTTSPGFQVYAALPLTTHDLAAPAPAADFRPPPTTPTPTATLVAPPPTDPPQTTAPAAPAGRPADPPEAVAVPAPAGPVGQP